MLPASPRQDGQTKKTASAGRKAKQIRQKNRQVPAEKPKNSSTPISRIFVFFFFAIHHKYFCIFSIFFSISYFLEAAGVYGLHCIGKPYKLTSGPKRKFAGRTSRGRAVVIRAAVLGQKLRAGPRNLGKTSIWVWTSLTRTRGRPWPQAVQKKKFGQINFGLIFRSLCSWNSLPLMDTNSNRFIVQVQLQVKTVSCNKVKTVHCNTDADFHL